MATEHSNADGTTALFVREADGLYRTATPKEIVASASRCVGKLFGRGSAITSAKDSVEFLTLKLAQKEHEVFCVLFLDTRNRVVAFEELSRGTIDQASVHAREVVKAALGHNAAAVILAHNHPSGEASPSAADKQLTARLKDALALIDVRVLDHIIIGDGFYSFAEHGLL
ncbi:MAG: DNA repair protein RadC [Chromatiales bacterium]